MSNDIDAVSRNRIISEMNRNFFVEAGAGSGKTTMLVNRMVAMVEAGVDISKISAITFTRAAAGEFYDRFQKKLIERSNVKSEGADEGRERRPGDLNPPTEESRKTMERSTGAGNFVPFFSSFTVSSHSGCAFSITSFSADHFGSFTKRSIKPMAININAAIKINSGW